MTADAATPRVEQSLERLRAASRQAGALVAGPAASAAAVSVASIDRAADAITTALELMRFQRTFVSGGPFRNEPFGRTPRMPAEPLWPAHADAFAALAAEGSHPPRDIDARASSERRAVLPARADIVPTGGQSPTARAGIAGPTASERAELPNARARLVAATGRETAPVPRADAGTSRLPAVSSPAAPADSAVLSVGEQPTTSPRAELATTEPPPGRLADARARAELAKLVNALEELQRQLLFDADCAESTDSLGNSRQYLQAAGYLDLAAAELASLV